MPRRRLKDRILLVLAWTSVSLAIPMAAASLYDSYVDAAWEEADMRWEKEDVERHAWIMGSLARIESRCVLR